MQIRLITVFFGIWIMPQRSKTIKSLQAPGFRPCHSEGKFLGIQDFPMSKKWCGCSSMLKISITYLPAPSWKWSSVWYAEQIPTCLFATGQFVAVYKDEINVIQELILWPDQLLCSQTCRKCKANMCSPREILITLPFGFVFFSKLQFSGKKKVFIVKKTSQTV